MRWSEFRAKVEKFGGRIQPGKKHDQAWIQCGDQWFGPARIGHHMKPMESHEIGGCARFLCISEHDFKEMVTCRIQHQEYCRIATRRQTALRPT